MGAGCINNYTFVACRILRLNGGLIDIEVSLPKKQTQIISVRRDKIEFRRFNGERVGKRALCACLLRQYGSNWAVVSIGQVDAPPMEVRVYRGKVYMEVDGRLTKFQSYQNLKRAKGTVKRRA